MQVDAKPVSARPLTVFALAVAARLTYLAQIRDLPYFDVPLVDGASYFQMAQTIAAGDLLGGRQAFWQPPLYPYLLALLLRLFGPNMVALSIVQAVLGSLTCVLVYLLGRRLFGDRAGLWAGGITALYGPLVHFDLQPLIPVLHLFLATAGLLLVARAAGLGDAGPGRGRDWCGAGLVWGLAAIATPNILLAVPPIAVWAGRRLRGWRPAGLFLAGAALPILLVTARNLAVAGEPVLISSNGGINFYIGNNPDYERTIRIRPGGEFERLAQQPENLGITGAAARSRWFTRRGLAFLGGYPAQAARLYAGKVKDLAAGREIPRNQDQYAYRGTSGLLAVLLWRAGVSFPFGVLAPLALAGLCVGRGRGPGGGNAAGAGGSAGGGPALLLLYAGAYAVSILMFFPTDRYRLPLIPVLALFAGRLLAVGRDAWKRPAILASLACGLVTFNLDAFQPGEAWPEEEALNRAYALRMKGRLEEARREYAAAIALQPERVDAYNALAAMAAQEQRWDEAVRQYGRLVERAPDFVEARRNLGAALQALGRTDDARREWEIAVHLAPAAGLPLADLCMSYMRGGELLVAEPYCARAVEARPDLPETHFALGFFARTARHPEVARRELSEAARLFPAGNPGKARAEKMLRNLERRPGPESTGTTAVEGSSGPAAGAAPEE